jgi:hypothetical protein
MRSYTQLPSLMSRAHPRAMDLERWTVDCGVHAMCVHACVRACVRIRVRGALMRLCMHARVSSHVAQT